MARKKSRLRLSEIVAAETNGGRRPARTAVEPRLWPDAVRPQVRILIRAGVVSPDGRQDRFVGSVEPGQLGAYVGPHPTLGRDGWHMVDVVGGYVPLHASQFERVEDAR